ncbi:MAG: RNA-binding protein [Gemmatimonas sp. SG8_28]|nr:MAG: RNA-binding protein [Gemmatimonas sp. SG8_28]
MRVLYIGGTGEISFDCIHESVRLGHDVTVFNRGDHNAGLPPECELVRGDINDNAAYGKLATQHFDVVCQFHLFTTEALERDIAIFHSRCDQYVFISSASAYEKPIRRLPITEATPLRNPFWAYSQAKADMEVMLRRSALRHTVVRPSHTYRTRVPTPMGDNIAVSRLLRGKPVVMHGDGESLWTVTHAEDFARPFARLLGDPRTIGQDFHITSDRQWPWNEILEAIAAALEVREFSLVHVPSPAWQGNLLGDKAYSVIFDNAKVKGVVGDFDCPIDPWRGTRMVTERYPPADHCDPAIDRLLDRIVCEQTGLGT